MQTLHQVKLAPYHTLATSDSEADTLLLIEHEDELSNIRPTDYLLGAGSNTLFIGEVKQRLAKLQFSGIAVQVHGDSVQLTAKAGNNWHELVQFSVEQGWYGLENLALIPGTVGAAPVQNIGAYGVECGEVIDNVTVFDRAEQKTHAIPASDCGFAYRQSHFKGDWKTRYVIIAVTFTLQKRGALKKTYPGIPAEVETPQQMFDAICALRRAKLPDPEQEPNAGSFFHNPIIRGEHFVQLRARHPTMPHFPATEGRVKIPAGWLIEQTGFKGVYHDGVGMSAQHALVLINQHRTGQAILAHARRIQHAVQQQFGIALHIEPNIVGDIS